LLAPALLFSGTPNGSSWGNRRLNLLIWDTPSRIFEFNTMSHPSGQAHHTEIIFMQSPWRPFDVSIHLFTGHECFQELNSVTLFDRACTALAFVKTIWQTWVSGRNYREDGIILSVCRCDRWTRRPIPKSFYKNLLRNGARPDEFFLHWRRQLAEMCNTFEVPHMPSASVSFHLHSHFGRLWRVWHKLRTIGYVSISVSFEGIVISSELVNYPFIEATINLIKTDIFLARLLGGIYGFVWFHNSPDLFLSHCVFSLFTGECKLAIAIISFAICHTLLPMTFPVESYCCFSRHDTIYSKSAHGRTIRIENL
jgi:hypothetical protein